MPVTNTDAGWRFFLTPADAFRFPLVADGTVADALLRLRPFGRYGRRTRCWFDDVATLWYAGWLRHDNLLFSNRLLMI